MKLDKYIYISLLVNYKSATRIVDVPFLHYESIKSMNTVSGNHVTAIRELFVIHDVVRCELIR